MDSVGPIKQGISQITTQIKHVAGRYELTSAAIEKTIIPKADAIATKMLNPDAVSINKLPAPQPEKTPLISHEPRAIKTGNHISETPRVETAPVQIAKGINPAEALLTLLGKSPSLGKLAQDYYKEAMALQRPKQHTEVANA